MSKLTDQAKSEASKYQHMIAPASRSKYNFGCGANAEGGGGFQPGNSCGGDGDGKDDKGDQGGGDKENKPRQAEYKPWQAGEATEEKANEALDAAYNMDLVKSEDIPEYEEMIHDGDYAKAIRVLDSLIQDELREEEEAMLQGLIGDQGIDADAPADKPKKEMPKNHRQQATDALKKADALGMPDTEYGMVEELIDEGDYEVAMGMIGDWIETEGLDTTPDPGKRSEAMERFDDAFVDADPDKLIEAYMDLTSEEMDSLGDDEKEMVKLLTGEPEVGALASEDMDELLGVANVALKEIESGDFSELSKHFEGLDNDQQASIMSEMQSPAVQDAILDADHAGNFEEIPLDDDGFAADGSWLPQDLMHLLENGEYDLAQEAIIGITKRLKEVSKSPSAAAREINALRETIGQAYLSGYEAGM